ncbi:hypothetical protein AA13594_2004 [Gluconacetobacter azotocaptans DSM 13594]|nr:hypothetical protein AA13594_2004 [Gluconacetobacter azotocaptans DSM 13594]
MVPITAVVIARAAVPGAGSMPAAARVEGIAAGMVAAPAEAVMDPAVVAPVAPAAASMGAGAPVVAAMAVAGMAEAITAAIRGRAHRRPDGNLEAVCQFFCETR